MCLDLLYNKVKILIHGHVLIEAAPFLSKLGKVNKYDWENNKLTFHLNNKDLDHILFELDSTRNRGTIKIIKSSKSFSKPATTFDLVLEDETKNLVLTLNLKREELAGIYRLLKQASVRIYNW